MVKGGLMQQWWHSVALSSHCSSSSLLLPCPPISQTSSWGAAGSGDQHSHRNQLFLSTQECRLIPPLFLLLPPRFRGAVDSHKPQQVRTSLHQNKSSTIVHTVGIGTAEPPFHKIKPKNSKHTIKKPFYNPMYTHTVDTSLTPFALFFSFLNLKIPQSKEILH